jgi:hypothetical protein
MAFDITKFLTENKILVSEADADTSYQHRRKEVFDLLKKINSALQQHEQRQRKESKNWGYVGDLGHAKKMLVEVLRAIGG